MRVPPRALRAAAATALRREGARREGARRGRAERARGEGARRGRAERAYGEGARRGRAERTRRDGANGARRRRGRRGAQRRHEETAERARGDDHNPAISAYNHEPQQRAVLDRRPRRHQAAPARLGGRPVLEIRLGVGRDAAAAPVVVVFGRSGRSALVVLGRRRSCGRGRGSGRNGGAHAPLLRAARRHPTTSTARLRRGGLLSCISAPRGRGCGRGCPPAPAPAPAPAATAASIAATRAARRPWSLARRQGRTRGRGSAAAASTTISARRARSTGTRACSGRRPAGATRPVLAALCGRHSPEGNKSHRVHLQTAIGLSEIQSRIALLAFRWPFFDSKKFAV